MLHQIDRHHAETMRAALVDLTPILAEFDAATESEQRHIAGERITPILQAQREAYALAARTIYINASEAANQMLLPHVADHHRRDNIVHQLDDISLLARDADGLLELGSPDTVRATARKVTQAFSTALQFTESADENSSADAIQNSGDIPPANDATAVDEGHTESSTEA